MSGDGGTRGFGAGLVRGLAQTAKALVRPAHTHEYPDVLPDLPPRSRGVIALLQENCTSCMLCARECPDWCIYIDSHKETIPAANGGRERQRNVLDRFAIDFSLCMYCGICIEVCPFDALFWSPEFEYAEVDIRDLLHEKERLAGWMGSVPPPPAPDQGAPEPKEVAASQRPARPARPAPAAAGERPARPERTARTAAAPVTAALTAAEAADVVAAREAPGAGDTSPPWDVAAPAEVPVAEAVVPEPVVEPVVEPERAAEPEAVVEPAPEAVVEPEPAAEPQAVVEPEPIAEPAPEPDAVVEPEPVAAPEPAAQAEPQPTAEPEPAPEPEAVEEPEPAPAPEPPRPAVEVIEPTAIDPGPQSRAASSRPKRPPRKTIAERDAEDGGSL